MAVIDTWKELRAKKKYLRWVQEVNEGAIVTWQNWRAADFSKLCQETKNLRISKEGSVSSHDWEEFVALQFCQLTTPP